MRERVRSACAVLALVLSASCSESGQQGNVAVSDGFLDNLVGSWELTGTMGSEALRQQVEAQWVVQGTYVQMHFLDDRSTSADKSPYEAIYVLGFDKESEQYVMHLFDTFGASYSRTIGIGTRQGDSVDFLFDYPAGQFSNTFTWKKSTRQWELLLRQRQQSGEWSVFASKTLTPSGQ